MSTLLKWFIFLLVFQVNTLGVCVCVCELSFAKPYDGIIIRLLVGFCFVIPEILPSYNSSSKCQAFIIPMTWAEKKCAPPLKIDVYGCVCFYSRHATIGIRESLTWQFQLNPDFGFYVHLCRFSFGCNWKIRVQPLIYLVHRSTEDDDDKFNLSYVDLRRMRKTLEISNVRSWLRAKDK